LHVAAIDRLGGDDASDLVDRADHLALGPIDGAAAGPALVEGRVARDPCRDKPRVSARRAVARDLRPGDAAGPAGAPGPARVGSPAAGEAGAAHRDVAVEVAAERRPRGERLRPP